MDQKTFTRRQVDRSFRKFKDIVDDLLSAQFQTWGDMFSHLIAHCENDPVMRVVTDPLRANKRVNADSWFRNCMASVCGMVGSARYQLPHDDEDRAALLYQFFMLIEKGAVDLQNFCIAAYGVTSFQDMVDIVNRELVLKFTREVSYRLDEIIMDLGDTQEVSSDAMTAFHYHDYSVNIHGDVQGSHIAGGQPANIVAVEQMSNSLVQQGTTDSIQSASFSSMDMQAVAQLIHDLKTKLPDLGLADEDERAVESDIATIEAQVSSPRPKMEVIKECLRTVRNIVEGIAGAGIVEGIKKLVGG